MPRLCLKLVYGQGTPAEQHSQAAGIWVCILTNSGWPQHSHDLAKALALDTCNAYPTFALHIPFGEVWEGTKAVSSGFRRSAASASRQCVGMLRHLPQGSLHLLPATRWWRLADGAARAVEQHKAGHRLYAERQHLQGSTVHGQNRVDSPNKQGHFAMTFGPHLWRPQLVLLRIQKRNLRPTVAAAGGHLHTHK